MISYQSSNTIPQSLALFTSHMLFSALSLWRHAIICLPVTRCHSQSNSGSSFAVRRNPEPESCDVETWQLKLLEVCCFLPFTPMGGRDNHPLDFHQINGGKILLVGSCHCHAGLTFPMILTLLSIARRVENSVPNRHSFKSTGERLKWSQGSFDAGWLLCKEVDTVIHPNCIGDYDEPDKPIEGSLWTNFHGVL